MGFVTLFMVCLLKIDPIFWQFASSLKQLILNKSTENHITSILIQIINKMWLISHTNKTRIFCTGLILEEGSENVKVKQKKKKNTAASSVGNTRKIDFPQSY